MIAFSLAPPAPTPGPSSASMAAAHKMARVVHTLGERPVLVAHTPNPVSARDSNPVLTNSRQPVHVAHTLSPASARDGNRIGASRRTRKPFGLVLVILGAGRRMSVRQQRTGTALGGGRVAVRAAGRVFIRQRQRGHCVGRPAAAHAQDQSTSRPVLVAHAPSPASGWDSNWRATATHAQGRRQRTRSMRPPRTGACRDADVGTRAARRGRRQRAEGAEGAQTAQGVRGACRRREGHADDETHRSCGRVVDVQQHARGGERAAVCVHKAGDGVAIESGGGSHMRAKAWSRGAGGRKQISTWKWMRKSDTRSHTVPSVCVITLRIRSPTRSLKLWPKQEHREGSKEGDFVKQDVL
ncbi:hypothetical protein GGX14DRAFT_408752 [Mycena pura]|uniref:Uncharacterized protein n=1 Tax=Mycena pura TaxID=153505 RepID=A0AAD6UPY9_9AGAR|nr:hypothetical protein GGX14DRAFT_408752 [Mycena pura]